MPHRCILPAERTALLAFPSERSELIWLYTFSEQDLSVINQRRGDANRLGFAILMCSLRYPGRALTPGSVLRGRNAFLAQAANAFSRIKRAMRFCPRCGLAHQKRQRIQRRPDRLTALPVDGKFILLPPKDKEDASE
jgi:Domain of unknown function (DUF4158)